jgi:transcription termination/antitermination protein NusG
LKTRTGGDKATANTTGKQRTDSVRAFFCLWFKSKGRPAPGRGSGMAKRWYSVSVLSNFEKKVAEAIRQAAEDRRHEDEIEEVLVPTEEVLEVRRGKKVTSERRFMPGYVLVRMEMNNRTYHLVNSINRVTGFLGQPGKPSPMRDEEVNLILNRVEQGQEAPRNLIRFEIGEHGQGLGRPLRGLLGHGRGSGRGQWPPEGDGVDLRPADAGRTGIHPGVERLLSVPWEASPAGCRPDH